MARNAATVDGPPNVPQLGDRGWLVHAKYDDTRGDQWRQFIGAAEAQRLVATAMADPKCKAVIAENWDHRFSGKAWPKNPNGMGYRPVTLRGEQW